MKQYLTEAFKQMELIESNEFTYDADGAKELADFMEKDTLDDFEAIIDPEAETTDDLKDSYIGDVICECQICKSKIFKAAEDIKLDNKDSELANVGEACPYCFETDGFKVIGQVAPFEEVTVETDGDADVKVKVDGKEIETDDEDLVKRHAKDNEDLEDSQRYPVEGTKQVNLTEARKKSRRHAKDNEDLEDSQRYPIKSPVGMKGLKEELDDAEQVETEEDTKLARARKMRLARHKKDNEDLEDSQRYPIKSPAPAQTGLAMMEGVSVRDKLEAAFPGVFNFDKKYEAYLKEEDETSQTGDDNNSNSTSSEFQKIVDDLQEIEDYGQFVAALRKLNDDQKLVFMDNFGKDNKDKVKPQVNEVSIDVKDLIPTQSEIDWKKSLDGIFKFGCKGAFSNPAGAGDPPLVYNGKYIIDGHHRWSQVYACNPNAKIKVVNYTYGKKDPDDVLKDFQGAVLAATGEIKVGSAGTNVWGANPVEMNKYVLSKMPDSVLKELNSYVSSITTKGQAANYFVNNLAQLAKNNKPYGGSSAPERTEMPQTNNDVKELVKSDGLTSMSENYTFRRPLKTSLIESMEDISITTDDTIIKVKATPRSDKEAIQPITDETKEVIETEEIAEEPVEEIAEETPETSETEQDVELTDVDEDAFSELGESYLKKVYDNVDSFKLTDGAISGNKLMLEGVIKFNSGKSAKTKFVFEGKTITKSGKVKLVGLNEHISTNKNSFTLTGTIRNKKLLSESLNYSYGARSDSGKMKRLYGTVKVCK